MKLSPKERAFCRAYVTLRQGKAAAIEAGYNPKRADVTASELVRKSKIKAEIERLESKLEEKALVTKQRIIKELSLIGFADMADYVTIGEEGQVNLKAFDAMPEGASRAVMAVEEKRSIRQTKDDSGDMIMDINTKYRHHSKIDALKELSKLHGYYPEEGTGEAKNIVYVFGSETK